MLIHDMQNQPVINSGAILPSTILACAIISYDICMYVYVYIYIIEMGIHKNTYYAPVLFHRAFKLQYKSVLK